MGMDDPFSADPKERTVSKTFWLRESTAEKLKRLLARAQDPRKIIAYVKAAIDREVERLEKILNEKN